MYRYAILPAQGFFLGEPIPATRRVAIIIPNRDQPEMLARCLGSIRKFTDMQTVEIIIVENGSHDPATFALYREQEILGDFRLLTWTGTFNYSAINNFAAKESDSDLILFLNNDIEILNEDWLMRLAAWTKRADLGIVGPTLLYPDGRLQHAGMVLGMVGSAGHLYRFAQQGESGYLDLLQDARDVGALTGACLMLRRDIFALVGGFDEGLAVTCNDTDLCLRIHAAGLRVVWTPEVCLLHHESVSRGHDRTAEQRARLENENAYLMGRWAHLMQQYEPLAHPAFVMEREDDLYVRLTRRQGR
jgi:GT2 family glycosyltransferase